MANGTCSVDRCEAPAYCRGYCANCYKRWRKHGDPTIFGTPGVKPGPVNECTFGGCHDPVNSHDLCGKHDARRRRTGDPGTPLKRIFGDHEARFWSKVDKRGPDECWPWTASCFEDGYGQFSEDSVVCGAHRWGYERFVAPIPDGWEVDHLCHTRERLTCKGGPSDPHRRCQNPAHWEAVPKKVNGERGVPTGKVSPEQVAALYARYLAGERVAALALEADILPGSLYKRFQRIAAT